MWLLPPPAAEAEDKFAAGTGRGEAFGVDLAAAGADADAAGAAPDDVDTDAADADDAAAAVAAAVAEAVTPALVPLLSLMCTSPPLSIAGAERSGQNETGGRATSRGEQLPPKLESRAIRQDRSLHSRRGGCTGRGAADCSCDGPKPS